MRPGCLLGAVILPTPPPTIHTYVGWYCPVFGFCLFKQFSVWVIHITTGVHHRGLLTDSAEFSFSRNLGFFHGWSWWGFSHSWVASFNCSLLVDDGSVGEKVTCTHLFVHGLFTPGNSENSPLSLVSYKLRCIKVVDHFFKHGLWLLNLRACVFYQASKAAHISTVNCCIPTHMLGVRGQLGYHSQKYHLLLGDGVSR